MSVTGDTSKLSFYDFNDQGPPGRQLDDETSLADISSIQSKRQQRKFHHQSCPQDWSIQLKCRQEKFQHLIVYQENLHHFMSTGLQERLRNRKLLFSSYKYYH